MLVRRLDVSRERVRQVELKALRKLRNLTRLARHTTVTGLFRQSAEILLPTWLLWLQFWHMQSLQGPPANSRLHHL